MLRKLALSMIVVGGLLGQGCATAPAPSKTDMSALVCSAEAFAPFTGAGSSTVAGQAFLKTRGGEPRYASGETVILVPAVDCAVDWWNRVGKLWAQRDNFPTAQPFVSALRRVVADATGNFEFTEVPAGMYYVRTQVTWEVPDGNVWTNDQQGGLVSDVVNAVEGKAARVMLTWK